MSWKPDLSQSLQRLAKSVLEMLDTDSFRVFEADAEVAKWANAASAVGRELSRSAAAEQLRHGSTWFVGVDALPNAPDGSIAGVALRGPWAADVPDLPLHRAQMSIIYAGYPQRDPAQSEANHRFRRHRCAAHVDGLLPVGVNRRRFAQEFHAYILGIPLNPCPAAPTVVWRGSHNVVARVLKQAIGEKDPRDVDLTDAYHAARREVFETCEKIPLVNTGVGSSFLIHRLALHGTEPWDPQIADDDGSGRMIAFFRPEFRDPSEWLG